MNKCYILTSWSGPSVGCTEFFEGTPEELREYQDSAADDWHILDEFDEEDHDLAYEEYLSISQDD